jgi:glutamyl-tRNA reductase
VGVSHRTAPLELRERLFIPRAGLSAMLDDLKRVQGVQEGLILSTCNRTELVTTLHDPIAGPGSLIDFLSVHQGLRAADIERHLYRLHDLQAVRHVFRVASSLDSLVVGEPQILGQVKDAYQASVERRMLGRVLDGLMRHSFEVARKVRTRTGIARHPVSVGQAAVGLARQIFGTLAGRTVMLIGAGKMSELAARQLVTEGVREVIVANRTHERALDMARRISGTAVAFE